MKYNNIIYNDVVNGEGMRVSFFTQGCSRHCPLCFNKETAWDFNGGKEFNKEVLDELIFVFNLYKDYYDGLSILGGEPLDNLDVTNILIDNFKNKFSDKTIWLWSGYTYEEILNDKNKFNTIKKCDILVDGRFVEELKDLKLKYRGSTNQRIIDIQESIKQNKIIIKEGYNIHE